MIVFCVEIAYFSLDKALTANDGTNMRLYCIIIICLYSSIDIRINGDTVDQTAFGLGTKGECTFLCWCWNHSCYWLPHRHGQYCDEFVIQLRNPFLRNDFLVSRAMFEATNDTCHWGCY